MKLLKINITIIITLFLIASISAKDYYSNSNKALFVFPEYASLGGAGLAFSRDAAPQSNPANIPLDSFSQVSLSYAGYYNNAFSTSFASFVSQLSKKIGLGMFAGYLYIPDIEITEYLEIDEETNAPVYDPSRIEIETSSETFFNFSLGYKIIENRRLHLSAGAALHCQRRRLIDWKGYGIGLDAGVTVMFPLNGLRVSLFADDITTNYIHWSSEYHDNGLPHIRIGLGWRRDIPNLYSRFSIMYKSPDLLSNDGVGYNLFSEKAEKIDEPYSNSVKDDPKLLLTSGCYGVEYVIYKVVSLRLGLNEPKRIFFGSGVNLFSQRLSFEFSLSGLVRSYELEGIYNLSTSFRW
jgi:hypothetical protein